MKKMLTPFLLGLTLALSNATVLADSSPTQQNDVGGVSLTTVLGSYDNHDVQFLALADGKLIESRQSECAGICTGRKDFSECMKLCMLGH